MEEAVTDCVKEGRESGRRKWTSGKRCRNCGIEPDRQRDGRKFPRGVSQIFVPPSFSLFSFLASRESSRKAGYSFHGRRETTGKTKLHCSPSTFHSLFPPHPLHGTLGVYTPPDTETDPLFFDSFQPRSLSVAEKIIVWRRRAIVLTELWPMFGWIVSLGFECPRETNGL